MRLSGALIAVGLMTALLVPSPNFAIAGFIVVGLGISNLVPILFGAAGRDPVLGAWTRHRRRYHVGLFWFSDRTGDDRTDVEVFWSSNSP
jgi:hypothetical protein